jgi:TRAP-type mannitol/chloroaromatic compound transport system permease small subunit
MKLLLKIAGLVDALNERVGRSIMWLVLVAVLLSAGNAIARKLFRVGSNALIDMQWYLFSGIFLLGAGYVFLKNIHVRIDFISGRLKPKVRSLIDIIGIIVFLIPFCWIVIRMSWPLFFNAWKSGEMSQNAGGLIRWPVYLLMPTGIALLFLQSISELIKRIAFLCGLIPDPLAHVQEEKASSGDKESGKSALEAS